MHAGVAVTVRHEQLARRRMYRYVGRTIEVTVTLPFARHSRNANRELLNSLNVKLPDVMPIIVNNVDVVITINLNPMRTSNRPMQHRPNQVAISIEHAKRIRPPIEHINVVLRVNGNRRSIAVERHAHRQLGPVRHRLKPSVSSNSRCRGGHGG